VQSKGIDNNEFEVDAVKYISFVTLPKILIVQFNRFEYDFESDSRRKLFDKVTFPQILNMNTFLRYVSYKLVTTILI
jgi:ubiquitin carboxyl-terminal hydrolase 47